MRPGTENLDLTDGFSRAIGVISLGVQSGRGSGAGLGGAGEGEGGQQDETSGHGTVQGGGRVPEGEGKRIGSFGVAIRA
jgi:hypothetical protein